MRPEHLTTDDGAEAYLDALLAYALDGNVAVDWVVQDNPVRTWYHAPWLDAGSHGREFVHGLTHELDASPMTLGPQQTEWAQTWAMGAYNARGAWAIGQVWCNPDAPDPEALNPIVGQPNSFPNGTVTFKLLFSSADLENAPFLAESLEWEADILADRTDPSKGRALQTVRLVQLDLAVRDDRLPLGWAFGTFTYAADAPGDTVWDRLVPVGLQWGNDPGITPAMVENGAVLSQQWVAKDLERFNLPDNHLGWAGRLAGPLDNPLSSCMSCHMTAGIPSVALVPEGAETTPQSGPDSLANVLPARERLAWFINLPAGVPFGNELRASTDYSLQTSVGLQNFYEQSCNAKALDESFSSRGPRRAAPRIEALVNCDELAASVADPPADSGAPWWLLTLVAVAAFIAGPLIGRLLPQFRRLTHRTEVTSD